MMKKTILLLLAAFCGVLTVAAQDLIIKADASKVEAKVTEITPESVRYKRFSNPDGPTYVLPVSEISYIQYANGEKEYFKAAASIPATPLTPAIPAEEPAKVSAAPAAAEAPAASPADGVKYVVKEYEIGEFYNQDGIKGVVCMLSDDRQHGLVISLDEIYLHWSEFRKPDLRDGARLGRDYLVFHLHGFKYYQHIALFDLLAGCDVDFENVAGHGGFYDLAGGKRSRRHGSRCGRRCGNSNGRSRCGGGDGVILVYEHGLTHFHLDLIYTVIQSYLIFHLP